MSGLFEEAAQRLMACKMKMNEARDILANGQATAREVHDELAAIYAGVAGGDELLRVADMIDNECDQVQELVMRALDMLEEGVSRAMQGLA